MVSFSASGAALDHETAVAGGQPITLVVLREDRGGPHEPGLITRASQPGLINIVISMVVVLR
jgi:hypothetical protein